VIRRRLHALDGFVRAQSGRTALAAALVDSGPILERDWAQRAGFGFTGKNTCTICPGHGSWLLLATLLVPEPLAADPTMAATTSEPDSQSVLKGLPAAADYGAWKVEVDGRTRSGTCGQCTRCLTACPTGAFVGPYHLDPGRCISYWTIETQSPIPLELRPRFANRIFGCDICQEVCPWNSRVAPIGEAQMLLPVQDDRMAPPLLEGFAPENPYWLHEDPFRRRFDKSPLLRARRAGMLRNVCVALGNWGAVETISALEMALQDADAAPRGHAAWALGQVGARHGAERVESSLRRRLRTEADAWVRMEIERALWMG
jgi:epoxyqueuosine reductase